MTVWQLWVTSSTKWVSWMSHVPISPMTSDRWCVESSISILPNIVPSPLPCRKSYICRITSFSMNFCKKIFPNRFPCDSKRWSPIGSDLLDLFCLDKTFLGRQLCTQHCKHSYQVGTKWSWNKSPRKMRTINYFKKKEINSQSLENTQVGYISQNTLWKNTQMGQIWIIMTKDDIPEARGSRLSPVQVL